MKHFLLIAIVVLISKKVFFFSFSMATIFKQKHSFFNVMQLINKNYSLKNRVKLIKNTQEKLS